MMNIIDIEDFMQRLEEEGLVIAPRVLVEKSQKLHQIDILRKRYLQKPALTFKEITEARIWGNVTVKAVKSFALEHARPDEVFLTPHGKRTRYKVVIEAVKRIARQRGNV